LFVAAINQGGAFFFCESPQDSPFPFCVGKAGPLELPAWIGNPSGEEPEMNRFEVIEAIVAARIAKGLKWGDIAKEVGQSKEWTTAALLGQMALTEKQAEKVGKLLALEKEAVLLLQQVPNKGSLPTAIPTDPLIYRFYELVNVYGTTLKALIHEEFGDGIMSAIDFHMDIQREPDPKGDRVRITMSGKFLPYKTW
jgi:cyanate lyase